MIDFIKTSAVFVVGVAVAVAVFMAVTAIQLAIASTTLPGDAGTAATEADVIEAGEQLRSVTIMHEFRGTVGRLSAGERREAGIRITMYADGVCTVVRDDRPLYPAGPEMRWEGVGENQLRIWNPEREDSPDNITATLNSDGDLVWSKWKGGNGWIPERVSFLFLKRTL